MRRLVKAGLALSLPWWGPLPLVWLVVAVACPEQLPSQQPVTLQGGQSVTVRAAPLPAAVHDTVWCSAGVCRPVPPTAHDTTPPSTAKGIGVGPFNATVGSLGTLFINANSPSGLRSQLAAAEAGGYRIFAAPCGGSHSLYMTNGSWDLAKLKGCLAKYRPDSATWRKAYQRGTLAGASLVDEPQCSSCWGGKAIPFNAVSQAACYARPIFGGLPISTRTNPSTMPAGLACIDGAMGQYDASMGSVVVWSTNQAAAAWAKGLVWTAGFNGDNGAKVVAGCRPSTTRVGKCQMSAAEITANFAALLKDSTTVCGGTMWFPNAATYATWAARSDIKAALSKVIAWGRTRPRPKRCGG